MTQSAQPIEQVTGPIKEAVIYVSRPNIRPLIKQELKLIGVEIIHTVEDSESCIEHMFLNTSALLVIDAELEQITLNSVLTAAQGSFNVDTRPILLVSQDMSPEVAAYAAEYNISRILTGEISRSTVQANLTAIVAEEKDEFGMRNTMVRIADARIRGDWDVSEFMLLDLYGRFPGNARIACELAENYINKNDWEQAKAIIEAIPESTETNIRVMHMRARCHMHAGSYGEAEEILQSCKLINPYNVDRLVDLGEVLMNLDRAQEALENFELAMQIDAERKDAFDGKVQCKLLAGDVNDALVLMRQITSSRELASLFNNAAILSIRHGHFSNGMHLYLTAIGTIGKREKEAARLFYNLGIAFIKNGKQREALTCFEKAATIDGKFYNTKHNANIIAAKLGSEIPYPELNDGSSAKQSSYDYSQPIEEEDIGGL